MRKAHGDDVPSGQPVEPVTAREADNYHGGRVIQVEVSRIAACLRAEALHKEKSGARGEAEERAREKEEGEARVPDRIQNFRSAAAARIPADSELGFPQIGCRNEGEKKRGKAEETHEGK